MGKRAVLIFPSGELKDETSGMVMIVEGLLDGEVESECNVLDQAVEITDGVKYTR